MAKWLRDQNLTIEDVQHFPLECVPAVGRDAAETRWTLRLKTHDGKGFNAFGAYGNPARQKRFWQRRHIKSHTASGRCMSARACACVGDCECDCLHGLVDVEAGPEVAPGTTGPIDLLDDSGDEVFGPTTADHTTC